MTAYYNEIDPHAAAWLRELIRAGEIAPGIVDERSIEDVRPDELLGYTQCHFFAGIGGWSLAMRLAGVPDDYPIWTGSCPCQPFSAAGKGAGFDDERHLWPSFQWLIQQCRPPVVAGEQVASKATGAWFDLVQADLEAMGYAFGLIPFPAAGIGAPHIRDRAYWLGHGIGAGLEGYTRHGNGATGRQEQSRSVAEAGCDVRLADNKKLGRREEYPDDGWEPAGSGAQGQSAGCLPVSAIGGVANCNSNGRSAGSEATKATGYGNSTGADGGNDRPESAGPTNGFWRAADWLLCQDGKWRPVEPTIECMADGLSDSLGYVRLQSHPDRPNEERIAFFPLIQKGKNRVMRLKGYGNAIVPQQAAIFIQAALGV